MKKNIFNLDIHHSKNIFAIAAVCIAIILFSCKKDKTSIAVTDTLVSSTAITLSPEYTPTQYRNMLGIGMDVDWAKTAQGTSNYNLQTVIDFKNRGLSHVRIRITDDMSPALLDFMEQVANDCISKNLIPVFAYQANAFKLNPTSDVELNAAVNWWKAVAERFKNYSAKLSFDLLIECTDALNTNPARLNLYFEKAVTEIRNYNTNRLIFISPVVRSDPDNLKLLTIPTKHNNFLLAEWHFYAAGPSRTSAPKLWTTGTAAEKKLITDNIDTAFAWQNRTGIPTWVGAWMPGDYNDGDTYTIAEQTVFAKFMSCQLKSKNIPQAINSDTKFYDRTSNTWLALRAPVLDSIINQHCP